MTPSSAPLAVTLPHSWWWLLGLLVAIGTTTVVLTAAWVFQDVLEWWRQHWRHLRARTD